MLRSEGDRLKRVVVCTPRHEYFSVVDLKAQNMIEVADPEEARRQHNTLKSILAGIGCTVVDVGELKGHPNSVFTRDTALCTPGGFIKLRMGLEARQGEEDWMAENLERMGEPCVGEIKSPGTVEGGDIILAGSVAFVGISVRTNNPGVKQIASLLGDMNYDVRTIKLPRIYIHLGGVMSLIGPDRILCCQGIFSDDFFRGFDVIEISSVNGSGANVICLGENEVIVDDKNVGVMRTLAARGVMVHGINLSEFKKGGGGPTCLILPVGRD